LVQEGVSSAMKNTLNKLDQPTSLRSEAVLER
jgi:hypothetical protein